MSSPASSPSVATQSPAPLVLELRGVGNVIPFKNRKRIAGRNRDKLITEPRVKEQMEAIIESFVSQLRSALATSDGATLTAAQRRSRIASLLPADDCWTIIPDERATGELCEIGQEGATITLTPL